MKKRTLSLLLMLCLVCSLLTVAAFAAEDVDAIFVINDATYFISSDGSITKAEGDETVEAELPDGVAYDYDSNTLTLTNANLNYLRISYTYTNNGHKWYYDLPNGGITLKLVGENTITNPEGGVDNGDNNAFVIDNDAHVTITGDGSLTVDAQHSGQEEYTGYAVIIGTGSSLTVSEDATLIAKVTGVSPYVTEENNWSEFVAISGDNQTDCEVTVCDNATLEAYGDSCGIRFVDLTVANNATLKTNCIDLSYNSDDCEDGMEPRVMTVEDNAQVTIDSDSETAYPDFVQNGLGLGSSASLKVTGGSLDITINNVQGDGNEARAINGENYTIDISGGAKVSAIVKGEAENEDSINSTDEDGNVIDNWRDFIAIDGDPANGSTLTVRDGASLYASGNGNGIRWLDITVDDATLTANSIALGWTVYDENGNLTGEAYTNTMTVSGDSVITIDNDEDEITDVRHTSLEIDAGSALSVTGGTMDVIADSVKGDGDICRAIRLNDGSIDIGGDAQVTALVKGETDNVIDEENTWTDLIAIDGNFEQNNTVTVSDNATLEAYGDCAGIRMVSILAEDNATVKTNSIRLERSVVEEDNDTARTLTVTDNATVDINSSYETEVAGDPNGDGIWMMFGAKVLVEGGTLNIDVTGETGYAGLESGFDTDQFDPEERTDLRTAIIVSGGEVNVSSDNYGLLLNFCDLTVSGGTMNVEGVDNRAYNSEIALSGGSLNVATTEYEGSVALFVNSSSMTVTGGTHVIGSAEKTNQMGLYAYDSEISFAGGSTELYGWENGMQSVVDCESESEVSTSDLDSGITIGSNMTVTNLDTDQDMTDWTMATLDYTGNYTDDENGTTYYWAERCFSYANDNGDDIGDWSDLVQAILICEDGSAVSLATTTDTLTSETDNVATFTLTSEPAVGTTFKVYDSETGTTQVGTATWTGKTLNVTLNTIPTEDTNYYISMKTPTSVEGARTKVTVKPYSESDAPAFVTTTDTLTTETDDEATFTLSKEPATGTTYTVYTSEDGDTTAGTATWNGTTLTVKLTTIPTETTNYYISATVPGSVESDRTKVTVNPYSETLTFTDTNDTLTTEKDDEATFELSKEPETGTTFKVYDSETGTTEVGTATLDGTTLTVKLNKIPTETTTYYVAIITPNGKETRVAVTVTPYTKETKPSETDGGFWFGLIIGRGDSEAVVESYEVKITDSDDGSISSNARRAEAGETVTITVIPADNYKLSSVSVVDENGKKVALKENKDGTYSFTMPASNVTVSAEFSEITGVASGAVGSVSKTYTTPFTDIANNKFKTAIGYCYENGLMEGTGATTFDPDSELTRAMVVTVLYRLSGSPIVTETSSFSDVEAGQWYSDAVVWATANGVVTGYTDGTFGPNDPVTREQLAAILYRYADAQGANVSSTYPLDGFSDNAGVSSYAVTPMMWAVNNGTLVSRTVAKLDAREAATRAEVANALMVLCEDVLK